MKIHLYNTPILIDTIIKGKAQSITLNEVNRKLNPQRKKKNGRSEQTVAPGQSMNYPKDKLKKALKHQVIYLSYFI